MANDTINSIAGGASTQGISLTSTSKNEEIGKNEFLTLLVTQLKNQDPEAPMDSKEFAVQLAQFTQVEKLISIDEQMKAQNEASSMGSMAGYLGHHVVLNSQDVVVRDGTGSSMQVDLAQDAGSLKVQLLNSQGTVIGEKEFTDLGSGKHTLSLDGLTVPDGAYATQVVASSPFGGQTFSPPASTVGLVSGFIPGLNPMLIIDGKEVSLTDVREVTTISSDGNA